MDKHTLTTECRDLLASAGLAHTKYLFSLATSIMAMGNATMKKSRPFSFQSEGVFHLYVAQWGASQDTS